MTANHAHTPTKAEIMDSYRRGRVWATPNGGRTYASEFERWYKKVIAAAEQRGAIKALREAADIKLGNEYYEILVEDELNARADDREIDLLEGDDE